MIFYLERFNWFVHHLLFNKCKRAAGFFKRWKNIKLVGSHCADQGSEKAVASNRDATEALHDLEHYN